VNVRCPVCGSAIKLAVGDTQLACMACGLAAPLSRLGTADGAPPSAQLALETDLTGTTLAGKTLVERIGVGGMGTVYRARATSAATSAVDVDVAIKVLRPGLGAERAAMLARFSREAEAMRRLEHVRIVRFLDHGEQNDIAYIVTELVEGRDLAARLAVNRMSLAETVAIFAQVCDGVAAAHAAGIVHRDLKPANILVGTDNNVKVADFGLAQLGADISIPTLTRTNVAMGTFHYLAPEQRKDAHAVDHRADIWALGVILYEMLTGELPLGSFVPPSTIGPAGCDRRVDAIINRALAPDPAARYATVADLARDVRALVAPRKISRLLLAGAAALVLAGGTTAAAFALSGDDAPTPAVTTAQPDAAISPTAQQPPPIDAAVIAIADATTVDKDTDEAPPTATGSGAPVAVAPPVKRVTKRPVVKPGGKSVRIPTGKAVVGKPSPIEGKVMKGKGKSSK
jgi:Protein kinase domain